MSRNGERIRLGKFERLVGDKVGIFVLVLISIVLISAIIISIYLWLANPPLFNAIRTQIFAALGAIPTALAFGASAVKWFFSFRKKILFKKSSPSVSANEGPKVLLWILDGCSVQAFMDVAEKNEDLKALYREGYFAQCVTIFPSITPAAHASIITGCYPSKTRLPAFDWVKVARGYPTGEAREYVRCMPDFKRFREEALKRKYQSEFFEDLGDALDLNLRLLSPLVYTIFETLGEDWYTVSVKEWIHRGADNFIGVSINGVLQDLVSAKITKQKSMIDLLTALYKEINYEFGDILWGSDSYTQLADLMVYWKTGTDTVSHEYGPRSDKVREEADEAMRKLAETVRFYKMHTNQPIYVIITADHSQSEVTQFSNLIAEFKRDMGTRYEVADREDRANPERIGEADIIAANNDRAAFFYTFGEKDARDKARDEIINYLKGRTEVDLIFYVEREQTKVIQVLQKGAFIRPEDIHVFFKDKEESYPNAIERIQGLVEADNWGDVAVSIKEGYTLNPDFKPEKEAEEILHGDHGGLNFSDSIAPLLIWGPAIRGNPKDGKWKTFRTVDIASTIAEIFKTEHSPTDGHVLREVFLNENEP